eukprot:scaffold8661_cov40-Cyclotella_meneghiniana.AAC.2
MSSVDGHPYLSEGSGCYLLIGAPPALPTMLINAFVDNLEVITSGHCRFVRRKSTMVSIHYQVFFYVGIRLIFGQVLRIRRLCSHTRDADKKILEFSQRLLARGHTKEALGPLFDKAEANARAYMQLSQ